ncbi:MAG: hypothetical protein K2J04_12300, partial [Lachnospiraceae bacterium]|nr:hypothetical protein [Lachnospiraceae bacterium]
SGQLVVPGSFSWGIIFATLIQFVGFSVLSIRNKNRCLDAISKYSLEIYLIHPIFCEVSMQLFGRIIKWFPAAWMIPVYSLVVIIACMGGAVFLHVRRH